MVPLKQEIINQMKYIVVVVDETESFCFTVSETLPEAKGIGYGVYCTAHEDVKVNIYSIDSAGKRKKVFVFGGGAPTQDEKSYAVNHEPPTEILSKFDDIC